MADPVLILDLRGQVGGSDGADRSRSRHAVAEGQAAGVPGADRGRTEPAQGVDPGTGGRLDREVRAVRTGPVQQQRGDRVDLLPEVEEALEDALVLGLPGDGLRDVGEERHPGLPRLGDPAGQEEVADIRRHQLDKGLAGHRIGDRDELGVEPVHLAAGIGNPDHRLPAARAAVDGDRYCGPEPAAVRRREPLQPLEIGIADRDSAGDSEQCARAAVGVAHPQLAVQ